MLDHWERVVKLNGGYRSVTYADTPGAERWITESLGSGRAQYQQAWRSAFFLSAGRKKGGAPDSTVAVCYPDPSRTSESIAEEIT